MAAAAASVDYEDLAARVANWVVMYQGLAKPLPRARMAVLMAYVMPAQADAMAGFLVEQCKTGEGLKNELVSKSKAGKPDTLLKLMKAVDSENVKVIAADAEVVARFTCGADLKAAIDTLKLQRLLTHVASDSAQAEAMAKYLVETCKTGEGLKDELVQKALKAQDTLAKLFKAVEIESKK